MESLLGYRPTVGELIFVLVAAIVAAPIWHRISRTWEYLLDQIASQSNNFRAKRIIQLEKQILWLREYDEHKALLYLLGRIIRLIVSWGMLLLLMLSISVLGIGTSLQQITEALHLTEPPFLGFALTAPSIFASQMAVAFGSMGATIIITVSSIEAILASRQIVYFSDPQRGIRRLEARISALRAKGSAPKTV
jgi:hypothetical protein